MDSATHDRAALEEQDQRLKVCEENLRRHHQLALAGQLVGATLHEVNNGLAILTNLIYLAKTPGQGAQEAAGFLEAADQELRRLGDITSKRLAFIRNDGEPHEFDLVELANSSLQIHKQAITKKNIDIRFESNQPVTASVKRGELLQVLVNLLLNAIEALPESGTLHVRVALRQDQAVITIADNGNGIPEDIQRSLFKSFKSCKENGTGIGLWIVKQIVDGHGGRIRYRTTTRPKRSGTVFRVGLPIRRAAPDSAQAKL